MLRSAACGLALAGVALAAPSYYKDIEPILQNHCQGCHRPGEIAPMSFLTYEDVRPWAKAIKAAVLEKKMPPWQADPHYGKFRNDRALSPETLSTLTAWVDAGAPEGDPKDAPAPVSFMEGWNIGKPDLVFEMPHAFDVPAQGTIDYQYTVIPTNFKEDTWVQAAEVRPGSRTTVHHVIAFIRPKGSKWLADLKPGEIVAPPKPERSERRDGDRRTDDGSELFGVDLLAGYAPGLQEQVLLPGQAKLVPAGSDIVLQLHYTATGKAASDLSKVGIVLAKGPVTRRVLTLSATNAKFEIPPYDPNYEVNSEMTLWADSKLVWMMPHMHLRGKDFRYKAVYPTGESQILLNIPHYDFNWQIAYEPQEPITLPKGTRIECLAHFDNSPNNPANPDPKKEVRWGDQTWEEMMIGWFGVAIDPKMDLRELFTAPKPDHKTD
jgi:hypothetical protein